MKLICIGELLPMNRKVEFLFLRSTNIIQLSHTYTFSYAGLSLQIKANKLKN